MQPFYVVPVCKPDSVLRRIAECLSFICAADPSRALRRERGEQPQPGYTWHFNPQGLSPARLPGRDVRSYHTFSPLPYRQAGKAVYFL